MVNLHKTGNPVSREERVKINENWDMIKARFSNLQYQINFLSGQEVDVIIKRINDAITNAEDVTADTEAKLTEINDALAQLSTVITNATDATNRADIAADEANTMNVILNRLKGELEQLQVDLTGIVQAEAQRVTNEGERGTAEQGRATAEITRRENEAARLLKEQARETAEQNRATTFNTKMLTAEEKITIMQYLIDNLRSYAYEADATYDFPNLIAWNGNTFIALQEVTGVTPSDDGINYRLVAQRGVDGTGAVSSVNGVSPTPDGNVQINLDVINNVTSDATDQGLSAAMGKFLMSLITALQNDKADATFVVEEVARAVAALVNEAPETLNTINDLAAALGDDPNFATTIMQMLGDKASNIALGQTNDLLTQTINNLSTTNTRLTTHLDKNASTSQKGHIQLSNDINSTSETLAPTMKALNEVKQYANDGKTAIANAVDLKGVSASPTDTFPTLANKIGQIQTGTDTSDATALASEILNGKTAYVKGQKLTGTMPNSRKKARGTAVSDGSGGFKVESLDFTPIVIFVYFDVNNYGSRINLYDGNTQIMTHSSGRVGGVFKQINIQPAYNGFTVYSTGGFPSNTTYQWYASE